MLLSFDGLKAPILFDGCGDLVESLAPLVNGWNYGEWRGGDVTPSITVTPEDGRYRLYSPELSVNPETFKAEYYGDACGALCSVIADLVTAYARDTETAFCLHCAGLQIGGHLIAFPATGRSGKSTMTVNLLAAGARLFSDDVLPLSLSEDRLVALGFAPRLRLPLARNAGKEFRDYVQKHKSLSSKRYRYVVPDKDQWAPHGETAALDAIVLLDRVTSAKKGAVLEPVSKSKTLQRMIKQNFSASIELPDRFQRLHDLTVETACYRLSYARSDQAVAALMDAFAGP
ncbi:MAG: hypothetical protein ISR48_09270 [Alphaproteobacteria bacterium]|nr:hypothetical protein [Alphaproteobacteria bacterium]